MKRAMSEFLKLLITFLLLFGGAGREFPILLAQTGKMDSPSKRGVRKPKRTLVEIEGQDPGRPPYPVEKPRPRLTGEDQAKAYLQFLRTESRRPAEDEIPLLLRDLDVFMQTYRNRPFLDKALWVKAGLLRQWEKEEPEAIVLLRILYEFPASSYQRRAKRRLDKLIQAKPEQFNALRGVFKQAPEGEDGEVSERLARMLDALSVIRQAPFYGPLRAEYEEFLMRFPDHAKADQILNLMAKNFAFDKKIRWSIHTYQNLLALHPQSQYRVQVHLGMGSLYAEEIKAYDKAVEAYKQVIDEYPESFETLTAYEKLAGLYKEKFRKPQVAVSVLEEIVLHYAGEEPALRALKEIARLYQEGLRDHKKAVEAYTRIADGFHGEEGLSALWEGAILAGRWKDYSLQVSVLKRVAKDYPKGEDAVQALFQAGSIYENKLKDYDAAASMFWEVRNRYPIHKLADKAMNRISKLADKRF